MRGDGYSREMAWLHAVTLTCCTLIGTSTAHLILLSQLRFENLPDANQARPSGTCDSPTTCSDLLIDFPSARQLSIKPSPPKKTTIVRFISYNTRKMRNDRGADTLNENAQVHHNKQGKDAPRKGSGLIPPGTCLQASHHRASGHSESPVRSGCTQSSLAP